MHLYRGAHHHSNNEKILNSQIECDQYLTPAPRVHFFIYNDLNQIIITSTCTFNKKNKNKNKRKDMFHFTQPWFFILI